MDNPKGFTGALQSALGESCVGSRLGQLYTCACMLSICESKLYFPRRSVVDVVCGRRSVAQEPGGGAGDGGAGVQRGHAANAGALHGAHSCHLHGTAVLRCWYGNQISRLCATHISFYFI